MYCGGLAAAEVMIQRVGEGYLTLSEVDGCNAGGQGPRCRWCVTEELLASSSGWAFSCRSYEPRGVPRRAAASALSDSDLLRRLTQPELLYRPLYLSGGSPTLL